MGLMSVMLHDSLQSGMVAGWFLDEASGTRADVFNITNFTDNNGVSQGTGKIDQCAVFDSDSTQYLTSPNNSRMTFTTYLSVSAWVKVPLSVPDNGSILGRFSGGTQDQFAAVVRAGSGDGLCTMGMVAVDGDIGSNVFFQISDNEFDTTSFVHVAFVFDLTQSTLATKAKMYLNGVLQSSSTLFTDGTVNSFQPTPDPVAMGAQTDGEGLLMNGSIDHTQVWNRILTPTEIVHLYNINLALRFPL